MSEKKYNNGEWTEARKKSFIISLLRAGTRRYPPKYEVLNQAKTVKKVNAETGRIAQHYKCAVCLLDFPQKNVQVDHIVPVVGPEGFTSWDEYIKNMFCSKDNLQVLCKEDHDRKTKLERASAKSLKEVG